MALLAEVNDQGHVVRAVHPYQTTAGHTTIIRGFPNAVNALREGGEGSSRVSLPPPEPLHSSDRVEIAVRLG